MFSQDDTHYMKAALNMARRGLGRTAPNPSVGCLLVKNNRVIAAGRTADGGRPHAEVMALAVAGYNAKGATAYVTLEPCSHMGETPPCAEALVKAGIKRVVAACEDSNPRIAGRGLKILKDAGIKTEVGLLGDEAKKLNQGFFLRIHENRPLVTLKIATTVDNKTTGTKRWITGDLARRHVHLERSKHDAILIGIETALQDDSLLTTRLPGLDHRITRIVLDTHLRLPETSQLVQTAKDTPLWIFHADDPVQKSKVLTAAGAKLFKTDPAALPGVLKMIAGEGITRLLVEGGPRVLHSFLEARLCDRFLWYKASAKGPGDSAGLAPGDITLIKALKPAEIRVLGEDLLEIYERKA